MIVIKNIKIFNVFYPNNPIKPLISLSLCSWQRNHLGKLAIINQLKVSTPATRRQKDKAQQKHWEKINCDKH